MLVALEIAIQGLDVVAEQIANVEANGEGGENAKQVGHAQRKLGPVQPESRNGNVNENKTPQRNVSYNRRRYDHSPISKALNNPCALFGPKRPSRKDYRGDAEVLQETHSYVLPNSVNFRGRASTTGSCTSSGNSADGTCLKNEQHRSRNTRVKSVTKFVHC